MARLYSVIFRLRRLFSRTGNLVRSDKCLCIMKNEFLTFYDLFSHNLRTAFQYSSVHFGMLSMNILMQNEGLVTDIDCNDNRNAYSYLPAFFEQVLKILLTFEN